MKSNADNVHRFASAHTAVERQPCADPERRKRLESNKVEWLQWYFAATFTRPFEQPHVAIINGAIKASEDGEWFVVGAERGLGKSTVLWAVVFMLAATGQEPFPVCLPWAKAALTRAMRFWKNALCFNERLKADYPEICLPFVHSRGVSQRLAAVHWADCETPTGAAMAISEGLIILPDNRGCIGGATINGNPRGLNHPQQDGKVLRPTIALLDDVQDRDVAKSEAQVESIIEIINGDVAGMGEAGTRMPMLMSGNCVKQNDVMHHYLSAREWRSLRVSCVESWPIGWDEESGEVRELWREWWDLAREHTSREAADSLYTQHPEMIAGMVLSAPKAWQINGADAGDEYRAVMREYFKMGESSFAAERQQDPKSNRPDAEYNLTAAAIRKQIGTLARGQLPEDLAGAVAFVDLNYHAAAWGVVAASNIPCYSVVDYGWWTPAKGKPVWQEKGATQALEVSIYRACESVVEMLLAASWGKSISAIAIDCGSKWASTVHAACKLLMAKKNPPPIYAAKGFASSMYREPYKRQLMKRRGYMADVRFMNPDREQMMQWDSHQWHMITQRGWLIPIGLPGSVCLYKPTGRMTHAQFAEEAAADVLEGVIEKNGKNQAVWKTTGRNEMGDVVAGAAALLSTLGVRPDAADDSKVSRRAARKARKIEGKAATVTPAQPIDGTEQAVKQPAAPQAGNGIMEPVKPSMRRGSWATRW